MDPLKNVSKVPEITPELLEANEEEQKQWRAMYSAPALSEDGYPAIVINDNLQLLDRLHAQIRNKPLSEIREHVAVMRRIREDTAIWAESIGRVDLARELTKPNTELRATCDAIQEAFERDDAEWCEHPRFQKDADGNTQQVAFRERDVMSPVHGRRVSIVRCSVCGFRNAKDLDRDLKKLSEHRAEAVRTGRDRPATLAEVLR